MQVRPVPKSSTSRLYNVHRGTNSKVLGTKRCIIWGRAHAVWVLVRPVPESSTGRLYNVDCGTQLKLFGTKCFIIGGRGSAVWLLVRPVPKFSTSQLYNVDRGTHVKVDRGTLLKILDRKRCIIWGCGRAGLPSTQILYWSIVQCGSWYTFETSSALKATQGQIDGFLSQLPYKCHQNRVASVGD